MMLSETEARTKRCPAPIGTLHDERVQNQCIASECMWWRWGNVGPADISEKIEAIKRHRAENNSSLTEAKDFVEANPGYIRAKDPTHGFCGAGGRPL